ncbi:tryptophanase [Streptomyces sp. NPDC058629]|uniref:tryptophanase n=1 Tax=Streptomyces sp. NPDC058629 TaxID=3346565 RepID=UPI0036674293
MFVEPYKIKMVEPIPFLSAEDRQRLLREAGHNLFRVEARHVTIDLLTDSGTGAMSAAQWGALLAGDESYAGATSWSFFEAAVKELTGHSHVLPVHQGRAAERILFGTLLEHGSLTVANGHFDTTIANVLLAGGKPVDLPCLESADTSSSFPFKGNLDLVALREVLTGADGSRVAMVILTITDNAGGGHPVSPGHAAEVRALCDEFDVPLFLDAARFAENAHLVTVRDPAHSGELPRGVAKELFRLAHGAWCSMKKDAFGNIGGFLSLTDDALAHECRNLLIATEGFSTYGGLAGRDLEALAQGLQEATDPAYLAHRADTASWFADELAAIGMPVLRPAGCHAVFLDAGALLPHLSPQQLPGVALAGEFYLQAGIRCAEMGTLTFGRMQRGAEPARAARRELLRLALPRRVYTRSHLEYVVEAAAAIVRRAHEVPGYRILSQPLHLRHFTATLEPLA